MEQFNLELVDWSRAQFALTAIYHWFFVPLTLGLSFIAAFVHTQYYKTGDIKWKNMTKFWMKLFGINFAIGVATGIILEFEFGTNWSNYSWIVGDIFGAPLAVEGILAFFLESTFIAVMFFGWGRVSKKFHMLSSWLVAFGSNLSALWILVANAWMQNPVGTKFNMDTARNEMVNFFDVALSPTAIFKFLHTVSQAYIIGALFVISVSAWYLLKKRHVLFAKRSILIAAIRNPKTGGRFEGLFLREIELSRVNTATWAALVRAKRTRPGRVYVLSRPDGSDAAVTLELIERLDEPPGAWVVRVRGEGVTSTPELLEWAGRTPLPPYIVQARKVQEVASDDTADRAWYQTAFAGASAGSVAAPTAGLHFTPELLERLAARGVARSEVVLHVGAGTFRPVEVDEVEAHDMHAEWCSLGTGGLEALQQRAAGLGRVIAVGTTSARTLESFAPLVAAGADVPASLETRLLITPPHAWAGLDGLMTNFHQPRSTLLAMVAALFPGGIDRVRAIYDEAIGEGYRFFSFGDAMLVLP